MSIFIYYLIVRNILAFVMYGLDMMRANAVQWRIRESILIGIALPFGALGAYLGMRFFHHKTEKLKFKITIPLILLAQCIILLGLILFNHGYQPDSKAREAMKSDAEVEVKQMSDGYLFDGPGDQNALIFYPGARVAAASYAPLLRGIAEEGTDVVLVNIMSKLTIPRKLAYKW